MAELGWISGDERDVLVKLYQPGGSKAAKSAKVAQTDDQRVRIAARDYLNLRKSHAGLLARGDASPVALAPASGAVGSSEAEAGDDGTTVVYAKSNRSYQGILGGAGAIIGGALGGAPGAAVGGAIGGVSGMIVDD